MTTETRDLKIAHYVDQKAPVLLMLLDKTGIIRHVNRFAARHLGGNLIGKRFSDMILNFHDTFQLEQFAACSDTAHLLSIDRSEGSSQTYEFHFYKLKNHILALGHLDIAEIESLSNELVAVNQELNNLTRQLNIKNRELMSANEKITELSRIDPLTQLANRRYFTERIEEMISLTNRKSQPLSLIMTDIDHFKNINDTFGHDAGDRVLRAYAGLMTLNTRKEDLVARFGGEEFIILLPFTDSLQAYEFSERIRMALSSADLLENGQVVTASFGVSLLMPGEGNESLIKRADTALYQAKTSGRNRTMISAENKKTEP
jgi:diguanylate cyclase (GGDEF)-like protein